jgi:hypothetical protein
MVSGKRNLDRNPTDNFYAAGECYCGNTLQAGSVLVATSQCDMLCDGNADEYCGAGDRLDVYQLDGTLPTTTGTGASSTSGTPPTTTSPVPTGLPSGWVNDGCWVDNLDGRILDDQLPDDDDLTIESCVNSCAALGYTVAGMEYSVQCFCGDAIVNGGAPAADQSDCNMACGGNPDEMCGAGNRMNIYNVGNLATYGIPVQQTSGLGSWTFSGCIS